MRGRTGPDRSGARLRLPADPRDAIDGTQMLVNMGVRRANLYLHEHDRKPRLTRFDLPVILREA
jgi:hypothetical protein